jgi:hypothetical protein
MKSLFLSPLVLCLLLGGLSHAQSLSEVAKKEKERRKKVGGKVEVITEKELSQAEGDNVSSMGETSDSSEHHEAWEKKETSAYEEMKERDELKDREIRQKWNVIGKEYGLAISGAQRSLADAERAWDENCTGKKRKDPRFSFSKQRAICQSYKDRIKEAKKELKRAQSDCMNAARKLGMLAERVRASCSVY